jgi:hypothetical protein
MKKERFDFVAMLISLFLLSVFIVEKELMGTIGGTLVYPARAEKPDADKEQGILQSSIISNSLLINAGASFKKNTVFNVKLSDADSKDGNDVRREQR